jgi:4-amino-4-deoxy-L-arabinose transferase-like glycosyltransferase
MKSKQNFHIFWAIAILIVAFAALYLAIEQGFFSHSDYDSYTRQAASWWSGQTSLPENVPWLEIAEYEGQYFISFPPFPSVAQFLLYPVFGMETPDNLINTLFAIGALVFIFLTFRRNKFGGVSAAVLALLMVLGSNLFYLSVTGWVWFSAQVQGFFFSALCVYLIFSKRKIAWYFAFLSLGIAFACRPFQILYFPLAVYLLYKNMQNGASIFKTLVSCIKYVLPLVFVGIAVAVYNYVRFDSLLEFGHNHLPEFAREPQFSFKYIGHNFLEILKLPQVVNGKLELPMFNGTLFFLVNPVYIMLVVSMIRQKFGIRQLIYLLCFTAHMVLMLSHKTMGGWQFGSRYLVDMIPFMTIMIIGDDVLKKRSIQRKAPVLPIILAVAGIAINVYGAIWFYTMA